MDISDKVLEAFSQVRREDFLPKEAKRYAGMNEPLHIGFDQTNSQPSTVAFMLTLLEVAPGDEILDIGSGSGWTTALLAFLTGQAGKVRGVEIVPELVKFGQNNLSKYKFGWAKIVQAAEGVFGYPQEAPYDKILVSASAGTLPKDLIKQLRKGGTLVVPVVNSVLRIQKHLDGHTDTEEYPGFAFVPLV